MDNLLKWAGIGLIGLSVSAIVAIAIGTFMSINDLEDDQ